MIVTLAAAALFSHTPAAASRTVIGTGVQTCAVALSPARRLEADTWTLGYWSGVNAAGRGNVEIEGGADAMLAKVHARCAAFTGVPLQDAVADVLAGKD